jgi:hypothetical protein
MKPTKAGCHVCQCRITGQHSNCFYHDSAK